MMNFPSYVNRIKREKYMETKAKNKSKEKKARKIAAVENWILMKCKVKKALKFIFKKLCI